MDRETFGELVIANQESLYRIAKSILLDDADCADAMQNAILRGFEKLSGLRRDELAKTWLVRILINECYQIARVKNKMVSMEGYQESGKKDSTINSYEKYSDLYEAILHLNEMERMSIVLYYFEEYTVKEIAQCLNSTETAIKKRLVRGREHLKKYMQEDVVYG